MYRIIRKYMKDGVEHAETLAWCQTPDRAARLISIFRSEMPYDEFTMEHRENAEIGKTVDCYDDRDQT